MKEMLCLRLPLQREMMTTVRLATGGVCAAVGMSYDDGEDCKVCVTESLLLLLRRGFGCADVSFVRTEEGIEVCVTGEEGHDLAPLGDEDSIALALLSALASDVSLTSDEGGPGAITFTFGKTA